MPLNLKDVEAIEEKINRLNDETPSQLWAEVLEVCRDLKLAQNALCVALPRVMGQEHGRTDSSGDYYARLAADHVRAAINAPVKCSDCGKIIPQIGGSVNKIEAYKPQIEKEPELIEQLREPEDRDEAKPDHYEWKVRTNPCECCGRQTLFPKCSGCSMIGHKRCRE